VGRCGLYNHKGQRGISVQEVQTRFRTIFGRLLNFCACSTHGRDGEMHTVFWSEKLKGRDHSQDVGVDGKITLEWMLGA